MTSSAPTAPPRLARLAALEDRAIREKDRATYNPTLGALALTLVAILGLALPSPWRVLNGEWSPRVLPSLLALAAHGVLVLSVIVAVRCGQVQARDLFEELYEQYFGTQRQRSPVPAAIEDPTTDRRAALQDVTNLKSLRSLSPPHKTPATADKPALGRLADALSTRSFFDPPAVQTVEEGKAYLRRLQQAARERESEESMHSSISAFGSGGYPGDGFGIYGTAGLLPRVYQASGFDPYLRDATEIKEEDALTTSSNPQVAWAQLEELGLAMFMHLYVRNIRRLLACHVKDFVEAFVQNALELNECGVMADVLLRRVPSQALLCPPGQSQQLTNVSLFDMLHNLTRHPAFVSKSRGTNLFEEHVTYEKYLNVGDATGTAYSSLERQEYVLERLIMLSKDRNLDRFRWNKGSTWKGKEWTDALPSDSEILMNVFSCILDNMLPADNERDRPFWKSYFLGKPPRRPFTTKMRNRLFVVQTVARPPHFKILAKGAVREIVPCEENCFHAIVVYLHAVKKQKAGHLESINLHRIIEQVFDVAK